MGISNSRKEAAHERHQPTRFYSAYARRCGSGNDYANNPRPPSPITITASINDGREIVRTSFAPTIYEPQDTAAWREARERFVRAVALPTLEVRA